MVEDDPTNRAVVTTILKALGCRVDVAGNGAEALLMIGDAHAYALILMDCQMPLLDGYLATAAIRQHECDTACGRRVPIVAMTANTAPDNRLRCLAAGMDDYINKPLRRRELEAVLQRWARGGGEAATERRHG